MKIALSSESTCDLPKELLEKYNISTSQFQTIITDNRLCTHYFNIKISR